MKEKIIQIQELVNTSKDAIDSIKTEMSKVIVGQKKLVEKLLVSLLTGGHILLESVPGLAKTTAISTLAKILDLKFKRIQFTPDLLPSDLIGNKIFNPHNSTFSIKKGPVFANFVLADEINRAPSKVQSALLEAMQEKQVTIGEETFQLEEPFLVMATQNPIEQEGTYPLPEAQVDRFLLKTVIDYPSQEEEIEIVSRMENYETFKPKIILQNQDIIKLQKICSQIYIDDSLKKYITDIVFISRYPKDNFKHLKQLIAYGASPRASIGLMNSSKAVALLKNRAYVIPEDIKEIAVDILRHRIIPTYEAEAEGVKSEDLVKSILDCAVVP